MKNYAIILASGTGKRFGGDIPKQFIKLGDKTVLEKCVEAFDINENIDGIIVVIHPEYIQKAEKLLSKYNKILKIIEGGITRQASSYNGVFALKDEDANVLIHDCARPFISQNIINNCIAAVKKYSAVTVATEVTDTIIEVGNNIIKSVPKRSNLMKNQTPQCFRLSLIKKAHEKANNLDFTDD